MNTKVRFTSYAQNLEDVMLNRVFSDVRDGLYIDVGACDPKQDSVTLGFYERGWSGINLEPNVDFYQKLCQQRKRDTNLRIAVSDHAGSVEFHQIHGSGISAIGEEAIKNAKALGYPVTTDCVSMDTLKSIVEQYCPDKTIHFLKIDVEGHEHQVIKGNDWSKIRPIVVLVETIASNGLESMFVQDWHTILVESDYLYVWFDGLNRYYVRKENQQLERFFKTPINIFDDFVLCRNHAWSIKTPWIRQHAAKLLPAQVKARLRKVYASLFGVSIR
jgi:FkbM family methyltransferase